MKWNGWKNQEELEPLNFVCGHCGVEIGAHRGYRYTSTDDKGIIYLCPRCGKPTFVHHNAYHPGAKVGYQVEKITDKMVAAIYEESRRCFAANSYTAVVLCCRKLLMHIAVDNGAESEKGFAYYAQYLLDQHFVPPKADGWVKAIKDKGNQANHEILLATRDDANNLLMFCGMLLKNVYEFPALSSLGISKS